MLGNRDSPLKNIFRKKSLAIKNEHGSAVLVFLFGAQPLFSKAFEKVSVSESKVKFIP